MPKQCAKTRRSSHSSSRGPPTSTSDESRDPRRTGVVIGLLRLMATDGKRKRLNDSRFSS
jgi:hypothetical protein